MSFVLFGDHTDSTAQYNAWCLNNGHHFTGKRGEVNWNQDLIWKMKSELEFQWELVEEEVVRVINELLGSLIVAMKSLQASIAGMYLLVNAIE